MAKTVIGLDLSTKTGYSVFKDGILTEWGLVSIPEENKEKFKTLPYPYNYIRSTEYLVNGIMEVLNKHNPSEIVIEETCASRNVYAQKQIEWIHYALNWGIERSFPDAKVFYLGSNKWRSILQLLQTKETKKHNKLVKAKEAKGKITAKHLSVWKVNDVYKLGFLMKHENEADGINLAAAHLKQHGELTHDYSKPLQSIEDR